MSIFEYSEKGREGGSIAYPCLCTCTLMDSYLYEHCPMLETPPSFWTASLELFVGNPKQCNEDPVHIYTQTHTCRHVHHKENPKAPFDKTFDTKGLLLLFDSHHVLSTTKHR